MATAKIAKKNSHLRHAEYYDLIEVFDDLYTKSKAQAVFYSMGYNLFTLRQASRRSWRINQTAPRVEVYMLYYKDTMCCWMSLCV